MDRMHTELYCDGSIQPHNPGGYACYGWVAYRVHGEEQEEIKSKYGLLGHGNGMTNNVAEYNALIDALSWAGQVELDRPLLVFMDSQLVIRQAMGDWKVHEAGLVTLQRKAQELLRHTKASMHWIPRHKNATADALAQKAYEQFVLKQAVTQQA